MLKSFMVSPLGTATGNAMEAVTNKTAGAVTEAVHNNAQGAVIDDAVKNDTTVLDMSGIEID